MNRRKTRDFAKVLVQQAKEGKNLQGISKKNLLIILKNYVTFSEAETILAQLDQETFEYIISNPLCSEYKQLSEYNDYVNVPDIEKEIKWISQFLIDYSKEINSFLTYEKLYESELLAGNYLQARKIIDQIENEITVSIWSIQQKLFIAELDKGFVANKDILSSVLSDDNSILFNFLTNYTSIRIEKNISISQYQGIVDDYMKALKFDSLNEYILFKVDFFRNLEFNDFSTLIVYDGTLSIIDRYKIFIQTSQLVLSKINYSQHIKDIFARTISLLKPQIYDIDLENLSLFNIRVDAPYSIDKKFIDFLDSYTNSDHDFIVKNGVEMISNNPWSFQIILIYCKSLTIKDLEHQKIGTENSLINQILNLVTSILKKDSKLNISETFFNLYKIAHFLGNHPLALGIYGFLSEMYPNKVHYSSDINLEILVLLNSKKINPAFFNVLDSKNRQKFSNILSKHSQNSTTLLLMENIKKNSFSIKKSLSDYTLRELKYIALALQKNNRFNQALEIYEYVFICTKFEKDLKVIHIYGEFAVGKYGCLIQLNKYLLALELACDILIKEPKFINQFYHPKFLEILISENNYQIQQNICLSIFFKFYEQDLDGYNIYVAYDNFLCSNSCETPKDFFEIFDSNDARHIIFLEKVCRHEILYSSPYFNNQEEMDIARTEILYFLGTNVSDFSPDEYEVAELLRKILVRKGIKQIDYSKIYVDVKGLKSNINKELKENFNRNVEIASLPLDQVNKIVDSIGNVLVYYLDDDDQEIGIANDELMNKLKLTSYNRFIHFKEAFLKIRNQFLFSSDHGLDTYLSMRIRHGTLPGQIRSIFESHKLITVWSETERGYLSNIFVLTKFPNLSEESKLDLGQLFNHFSKAIDDLSEELKSQIIQIQTEENLSKGLFDYSYSESGLLELFQNKFGHIKEFEIFTEKVIDILWARTNENLETVRNYLTVEYTEMLNLIFNDLELKINKIKEFEERTPELKVLFSTIKDCHTEIVVEVKKIAEWFRISNKKYIEEFDFSILLDTSVNTLQRSFKNASIEIKNETSLKFDGDLFPHFADIFFYLLHNALKHSRLPSEHLELKINITNDSDYVTIGISNNVLNDEEYISQLKERVIKTKKILGDPKLTEKIINKEGGTGFPKIKKALSQNLGRKDYGIHISINQEGDNAIFNAIISFEFKDLLKN